MYCLRTQQHTWMEQDLNCHPFSYWTNRLYLLSHSRPLGCSFTAFFSIDANRVTSLQLINDLKPLVTVHSGVRLHCVLGHLHPGSQGDNYGMSGGSSQIMEPAICSWSLLCCCASVREMAEKFSPNTHLEWASAVCICQRRANWTSHEVSRAKVHMALSYKCEPWLIHPLLFQSRVHR